MLNSSDEGKSSEESREHVISVDDTPEEVGGPSDEAPVLSPPVLEKVVDLEKGDEFTTPRSNRVFPPRQVTIVDTPIICGTPPPKEVSNLTPDHRPTVTSTPFVRETSEEKGGACSSPTLPEAVSVPVIDPPQVAVPVPETAEEQEKEIESATIRYKEMMAEIEMPPVPLYGMMAEEMLDLLHDLWDDAMARHWPTEHIDAAARTLCQGRKYPGALPIAEKHRHLAIDPRTVPSSATTLPSVVENQEASEHNVRQEQVDSVPAVVQEKSSEVVPETSSVSAVNQNIDSHPPSQVLYGPPREVQPVETRIDQIMVEGTNPPSLVQPVPVQSVTAETTPVP